MLKIDSADLRELDSYGAIARTEKGYINWEGHKTVRFVRLDFRIRGLSAMWVNQKNT